MKEMIQMNDKYIKNISKEIDFSKNGFSVNLPKIDNKDISICFVETKNGRDNYCMLDTSTMFYYIIDGNGIFIINDEKCQIKTGDLIEIPPKHKYTYTGNLKMLEVQTPAFNQNDVHEF